MCLQDFLDFLDPEESHISMKYDGISGEELRRIDSFDDMERERLWIDGIGIGESGFICIKVSWIGDEE